MSDSDLEAIYLWQVYAAGLPEPVREYKAIPTRRYHYDFAWPARKLLVEIQGGIWTRGAHARGAGIERDYEKTNLAMLAGWRVLQFSGGMVKSGEALEFTQRILNTEAK